MFSKKKKIRSLVRAANNRLRKGINVKSIPDKSEKLIGGVLAKIKRECERWPNDFPLLDVSLDG